MRRRTLEPGRGVSPQPVEDLLCNLPVSERLRGSQRLDRDVSAGLVEASPRGVDGERTAAIFRDERGEGAAAAPRTPTSESCASAARTRRPHHARGDAQRAPPLPLVTISREKVDEPGCSALLVSEPSAAAR